MSEKVKIRFLEADHKWPVDPGGTNDMGNPQLLCGPCNRSKNNKVMEGG